MSRAPTRIIPAFVLAWITVWAGCSASTSAPQAASDAQPAAKAEDETAAALAKLEPADRLAATEQATCPVSEHALGSMGAPIKVAHDGKEVFLCCEGCKEEFDKDPAAFLAKLKK
jgi:YHS domain-containing protein